MLKRNRFSKRQKEIGRTHENACISFGLIVFAGVVGGINSKTHAATGTWKATATTGDWATAGNWSASPAPTAADTATFANGGNGHTTITIDSGRTVKSITFDPTLTSLASYIIGSAGVDAGNTLSLASGGVVSITNGAGVTGLTETFNAPLSLGGSYTFTNSQTGAGSNFIFAGDITNTATSTLTINGAGTSQTNEISGAISDGSGSTVQSVSMSQTAGVWTLSGTNSYSGATAFGGSGGTTILTGSNSSAGTTAFGGTMIVELNSASNGGLASGAITFGGGQIAALTTGRSISNTLNLTSLTAVGSQSLTFNGAGTIHTGAVRTFTFNNAATTTFTNTIKLTDASAGTTLIIAGSGAVTFSGALSNGGGSNGGQAGTIEYSGNNVLTLSGANTDLSPLTIDSGGTVSINTLANGAVGTTITTVASSTSATVSSATGLAVGQNLVAVNGSGGNSNLAYNTTITAISGLNISLSTAAVTTNGLGGFAGFANSLGLTGSAATSLILNGGTLQYTGAAVTTNRIFTVTSNGGTIDASGTGALVLGSTSSLVLTGTGTRTLTLTGTSSSSNVNTLSPLLGDGTGGATSLQKTGSNTWALTKANTFTGGTTVLAGILATGATGNLGVGNVTVDGTGGTTPVLELGNATSINDSATLSLSNGATVQLNFGNGTSDTVETVSKLVLDGTVFTTGYFSKSNGFIVNGTDYSSYFAGSNNFTAIAVPEPASFAVGTLGVLSLMARRRRKSI